MKLKIYFSNQGWQGSTTIVASSWESAFEIAKPEYDSIDFNSFKEIFKEYEIEDGLILIVDGMFNL